MTRNLVFSKVIQAMIKRKTNYADDPATYKSGDNSKRNDSRLFFNFIEGEMRVKNIILALQSSWY
jgi:hypothetical protein